DPDTLCGQQGWFGEESLDIEAVHSFAPGANILYVGATTCEGDALNDVLYDTIDSFSPPDIISNSWSENGEFTTPNEQLVNNDQFLQAAAQGISVLFATGDDGDLSQVNGVASGSWPGNSPWVTAVGGTTLALQNSSGDKQEWGWGNYRAFLGGTAKITSGGTVITASDKLGAFSFYGGAGGGVSFYQPQPSYQKGVVPASISTVTYSVVGEPMFYSPPRRVVPDVAMEADPYTGFLVGETYTIAGDPISDGPCTAYSKTTEYCEDSIGGTSLATPSLAGVLALVNQARHQKGLSPVGFFNPALYNLKVGVSGTHAQPLIDVDAPATPTALLRAYPASLKENPRVVTVNSQVFSGCPGRVCEGVDDVFLTTTKAFDNVTGRGTPWVPSLITALGG
ncbi:MAG TPA: S53 family peptidase, partial [Alphaproteobacteria bacterium]|nr:S53 family peptidase [Alphaproteobacteria bacterium]